MSDEKKRKSAMWDCTYLKGVRKGEPCVYHSSTAETLEKKGWIKILKEIKKYRPKTMKE